MCLKIINVYFLLFVALTGFFPKINNVQAANMTMEQKLGALRAQMKSDGFDAYVITSEDEHQSEYVSKYDKRRAWISGFTGSTGTAVVTMDKAAVWADSRYWISASAQLDKNWWTLQKDGSAGVDSIEVWLSKQLGPGKVVGQFSRFTSINGWQSRESALKENGVSFKSPDIELIDIVWPSTERDPKPNSKIQIHDIKYAGLTWQDKIKMVAQKIKDNGADVFVVTALDEVAWLLNLRAADIPYNPMFFAYVIINAKSNQNSLFIDRGRLDTNLLTYLLGIRITDYEDITGELEQLSQQNFKIWVSPFSSYAIYNAVTNKTNLLNTKASPVRSIKSVKTETELKNFRECQIRDSAARIRHMNWLETEMNKGSIITEMTSADKLESIQQEDQLFKMLSFNSISAVGANAAIVHYNTDEGDNSTLTKDKVYLLDAGAQYEDCTTDITRTHHYGKPKEKEIYAYTRVLQGSINLANVVFPNNLVYGRTLDLEAREPLWRSGMDYGHGTGHGIGYFLSVHESPPSISYGSTSIYDERYVAGMIASDEPGYYLENEFGIRLETDIESVVVQTKFSYANRVHLKFSAMTLVPFEKNLIDQCALTNEQVDWLNQYNKDIREKVGPRLSASYKNDYDYMIRITEPFKYTSMLRECGGSDYIGSGMHLKAGMIGSLLTILTSLRYFL